MTWLVVAVVVGGGIATLVIQRRAADDAFYRGSANALVTADRWLATPFSTATPTRVRVILSNWNARKARSQWTVQLVEIRVR